MTKVGKEHGIYQGIPTRKQPKRQTKKTACEKLCEMAESKCGKNSKAAEFPKFCRKKRKTSKKLAKTNQFDFIEILITEKGLAGKNICQTIFSYLDFSTLTEAHQVSKTWNQFLTQRKCIWMEKLRRIEPVLGRICSLCEFGKLFDSLERKGKIEDIIDTFMSIQYLKVVYDTRLYDYTVNLVDFKNHEIGEKFEYDFLCHVEKLRRQNKVFPNKIKKMGDSETAEKFEKIQRERKEISCLLNTSEKSYFSIFVQCRLDCTVQYHFCYS